ncbi:MAG: PAS domain S-box protein, partial [Proteobacteria bacterium]|nr:PAS domain S-box protein [Pseudomonadota bacterium]
YPERLKYRSLIEHSSDVVFCVDKNGEYKFVNQVFASTFGKTPDYFLGKTFWDIYPKEHADHRQATSIKVFETGESQSVEVVVPLPDKTLYYIAKANPVRDETGKVVLNLTHAIDITDRKRVEEALRQSEIRYRTLFTRANDGIFIISSEGKLIDVNESLARMHGYSVQEMLDMNLKDLDTPETAQLILERMHSVMAGEALTFEVEHYHKDGHVFPLEVSVSLISSGGESCIQCFQRDITERKQAEEDLKESVGHLRRAIHTTIQVLVLAVETKDPYTAGHQKRTTNLARAMAAEMNLPPEKIEGLRMAGAIHDIGKISIPSEILSKPTELPAIEYSLIKEHARHGYEILKDVESPWPLADIVYQHHERINGSGYPRGLKGEEILIEARILAVADVVEAMASHRPYRPALGMGAALEEIEKNRGILYDPAAVETCLRLIREKGFQLEVDAYPIDKNPLRPGRGRNMPPAVPGQEVPN